jgi:hypothetical protein
MPRINEMPRFRTHTRTGNNGQSWTSYWWDGRALGIKDISLGTEYGAAVEKWRACEAKLAADLAETDWQRGAVAAADAARDAVELMRLLLRATEGRPRPGVYFLLDEAGGVLYVGQSDNVLVRMRGHPEKGYESLRMIRADDYEERLELERRFIRLLKPPLNLVLVGPAEVAA